MSIERKDLIALPWEDYELLDSGDGRKLEKFGAYTLIRPETQALWQTQRSELWKNAQCEFVWSEGKGSWVGQKLPEQWTISSLNMKLVMRLTAFKHTGVFPEQAGNWQWIGDRVRSLQNPEVLNLFGYTGASSIAAAQAGATVTHLDASRQSNAWAKENALSSAIPAEQIRYILDDAVKFAEREVRRERQYQGIILDPPAFGRGPKGEVWHIEEDLPRLLQLLQALLSPAPGSFFLLNGYAAGYSPHSFLQAVESVFSKSLDGEFGELLMAESNSSRTVPSGIFVRFTRNSG
jgi:23S rRNA (cytosine1962-C5)-methyltransferase